MAQQDTIEPSVTPLPVAAPVPESAPKEKGSDLKNTLASILILCMAPIIAVLLTLFVFQSYQVDGPSMESTLHNNDRLIVWKAPRTMARVTGKQYVPNRGDVIIFSEPGLGNYDEPDGSKQLVKRVIGLPGDHIVVKNGSITIYNKANPAGFNPDTTLPYGKEHAMPTTDDDVDVTLASNELFVCGDNRPNSLDSRMFGPIKTSQVVGKLVMRILPLSQTKIF
jgi:signal peptidase I